MEILACAAVENLSPAQLKIFNNLKFDAGLKAVTAGAGAGKTRTLSYLILKALLDETLNNVFVLTATRTAKDEAFARVSKLHTDLGFLLSGECPILPARNVRTIHSICLGFARDRAAEEGASGVDVVGEGAIKEVLVEILEGMEAELRAKRRALDDDADDKDPNAIPDVASLIEMPVDEAATFLRSVRSERLQTCTPVVDGSFGPTAQKALAALEQRMAADPETGSVSMDFNGMIDSFRVSERALVLPGDVLFVDEAQDLSRCQLEILLTALKAGACVVVLGDDSQGIYQFSGACNQTIVELKQRARRAGVDVTNFALMTNFRSTNSIVRASERLLPLADRQMRVGVKGNGSEGEPVEVLLSKDDTHEAKAVAERLVALLKEGVYVAGDIAILRHKNFSWNDPLVKELRNAAGDAGIDVPVAIVGQDASQSLAGKFLAVFEACTDLERFCDVPTEGFEIVKSFLKSIRGHRGWNQKLGLRALEEVFVKHLASDPMAVFWRYREDVLAQFRLLEDQ